MDNTTFSAYDNIISALAQLEEKERRFRETQERGLDRVKRMVANPKNLANAFTPIRRFHELADDGNLSKAGEATLRTIAILLGRKHWRYITQATIAKNAGRSERTIQRGMKELEAAGIIAIKYKYRPKKRQDRKPSPSRSSTLVWFVDLTRVYASHRMGRSVKGVPADKLYDAISPEVMVELAEKIPPRHEFIPAKIAKFIPAKNEVHTRQNGGNSFIDVIGNPEAGKSASPERES